jgi:colanic acid/amylovoran biosynthesis protein
MARRLGKPLVLFTQSVGRFRDPALRSQLRNALAYASLILVRDPESRDNLLELGLSGGRIHRVADAAFALADLQALAPASKRSFPQHGARVAVSVREWRHFRTTTRDAGMARYSEAVAALARHLVSKGHEVTFVSTCQGVPEYWTDDSAVAKRILEEGRIALGERVAVDTRFHTPSELSAQLGSFDAVVATRMHAAILALSAGTPVLAIDYEDKARRLFGQLGVPEWSVDIDSASPALFCRAWDLFASEVDARRAGLFREVTAQANDARRSASHLRSAIAG